MAGGSASINVIPYDDRESGPNWRSQRGVNVGEAERWASIFGGAALVAAGLKKGSIPGLAVSALGGGLLWRGLTGHCRVYDTMDISTSGAASKGLHVVKAVTIDKPAEELYHFWRNFENLPQFMNHLEAVTVQDTTHSHWVAKGPAGKSIEWDAEIINEVEGKLISWRSLENADVENAGTVNFKAGPVGRGTEVKVTLQYLPPGGIVGAKLAMLLGQEPSMQIEDDLNRFKSLMEAGEIATTQGQSKGS